MSGRAEAVGASPRPAVRPFEARDLPQVLAVYREVFGEPAAVAFEKRWRWSQIENLHAAETPRWVLEAGPEVVGYLGTVPQLYRIGGASVLAHATADYMVKPELRFSGLSLMKAFFKTCENCISCDDMPATIKVTEWLGARPAGRMVRYVKPLTGRAVPSSGLAARLPLPARDAAVRLREAWLGLRRGARAPRARVEPAEAFDKRYEAFSKALSRTIPATTARDLRFFDWRYGPGSPHASRQMAEAYGGGGEMTGYVVSYLARDRTGYVLDLQSLPAGDRGISDSLLRHAVKGLRRAGAWKAVYPYFEAPAAAPHDLLLAQGFVPRGGYTLLVKLADPRLMELACRADSWNIRYGDIEASHGIV